MKRTGLLANPPREETAPSHVGLAAFLFWTIVPLLMALILLTWSRVEARRLQYEVSVMSQQQQDWAARAKRAEAQWQATSSREQLRRGAVLLDLQNPEVHQRWTESP
ncbi:MAG: hypothetical protein VX405_10330 [Myxococcota bacterium]|jgi:hypothetical protein|nr:hypothetical protein [Myxococcales bacterium]MEC7751889.1 hypothetical protein [Myxococcota bacterium]